MNFLKLCVLGLTLATVTGCSNTRYAWNDYDQKLYNYYKTPAESEQFVEALQEAVADAEAVGKVPPGLYAEYGYMLYEKGNFPSSIVYFKKEYEKWPESRVLMLKMISNVEKKAFQNQGKEKKLAAKETVPVQSPKGEAL